MGVAALLATSEEEPEVIPLAYGGFAVLNETIKIQPDGINMLDSSVLIPKKSLVMIVELYPHVGSAISQEFIDIQSPGNTKWAVCHIIPHISSTIRKPFLYLVEEQFITTIPKDEASRRMVACLSLGNHETTYEDYPAVDGRTDLPAPIEPGMEDAGIDPLSV